MTKREQERKRRDHLRRLREKVKMFEERHKLMGLCRYCSEPLAPGSKSRCMRHLLIKRLRARRGLFARVREDAADLRHGYYDPWTNQLVM